MQWNNRTTQWVFCEIKCGMKNGKQKTKKTKKLLTNETFTLFLILKHVFPQTQHVVTSAISEIRLNLRDFVDSDRFNGPLLYFNELDYFVVHLKLIVITLPMSCSKSCRFFFKQKIFKFDPGGVFYKKKIFFFVVCVGEGEKNKKKRN